MLNNIKALVVVLFFATAIFVLARSTCLNFMTEEDFRRRRAAWYATTFAAFLSPSIWLFIAVAIVIAIWAARKDPNPVAISMFIGFATPSFFLDVPHLFAVNSGTVSVFFIVIPVLLRQALHKSPANGSEPRQQGNWLMSLLLFAFLTLQVLPYFQVENWSSLLRRIFVQIVLALPGFWFITRTLRSYRSINEVMASFVLCCAIMAPVAVFEATRGWLLYIGVPEHWGATPNIFSYLMRGGRVRALATTDHSLALGLFMALSFGFCWHLQRWVKSRKAVVAAMLLMWAGLFAAYSRGAWIVAILIMFTYLWLMPKGAGRVVKVAIIAGVLGAAFALTPFGDRVIDVLPFVGKQETGNLDYRMALLDRALQLIPQHPWFGDLQVLRHMEDLRQGQGIIDIVNGYLLIALFYGLAPLVVLAWFVLIALWKVRRAALRTRHYDMNAYSLGCILIACVAGVLFFIWSARFAGELTMLCAMGLAYAKLGPQDQHPVK